MDLVTPLLLLSVACKPTTIDEPTELTSRGAFVLRPANAPDAELVAIPMGPRSNQQAYLVYTNPAGRAAGLHGGPIANLISREGANLVLGWDGDVQQEYGVVHFDEPLPAPGAYVRDMETVRPYVEDLNPGFPCTFDSDEVQPLLDSGLSVEQITNAVTLKWRGPKGRNAAGPPQPSALLRTSVEQAPAIAAQLRKLAREPSIGLDNRIMAVGALLSVTPPDQIQALVEEDFGHDVVNGFVSQHTYMMTCDRQYFASMPR